MGMVDAQNVEHVQRAYHFKNQMELAVGLDNFKTKKNLLIDQSV